MYLDLERKKENIVLFLFSATKVLRSSNELTNKHSLMYTSFVDFSGVATEGCGSLP